MYFNLFSNGRLPDVKLDQIYVIRGLEERLNKIECKIDRILDKVTDTEHLTEALIVKVDTMANQAERLTAAVTRLIKEQVEILAKVRELLAEHAEDNPQIEEAITGIDNVSNALNEFTPENPPPPPEEETPA